MTSLISTLKHRITIEEPVTVSDGGGGYTTTWEEVAEVFAALTVKSGREVLEHQQIQSKKLLRATIRYRDDINTSMRIVLDGEYFDIRSIINPDMKKIALELELEEQQS